MLNTSGAVIFSEGARRRQNPADKHSCADIRYDITAFGLMLDKMIVLAS